MENYNFIIQSITTVGFPIVTSLIMMYLVYTQNKTHKAEMSEVVKALENNTIAITHLADILTTKQ